MRGRTNAVSVQSSKLDTWTQNVHVEYSDTTTTQAVTLTGEAESVSSFGRYSKSNYVGGFMCARNGDSYGEARYTYPASLDTVYISGELSRDGKTITLTLRSVGGSGDTNITLYCVGKK